MLSMCYEASTTSKLNESSWPNATGNIPNLMMSALNEMHVHYHDDNNNNLTEKC